MKNDIRTGIENGMIWGFVIGGLYVIAMTGFEIFNMWLVFGWNETIFYFGLFGLFVGLGMIALAGKWITEQTEQD